MNKLLSDIFENEENVLKTAEELIYSKKYNKDPLIEQFIELTSSFRKTLKEYAKIVRISDGQQEYLQRIQFDLKKQIDERIKIEEKLHYLATIDSLTGVNNRAFGISILENQVRQLKRTKDTFTVCFIDVNGLKTINDSLGHYEGDEVLVVICRFIKQVIRDCDIVCRLGGDEFLIIFPQCNKDSAELVMERILSKVNMENLKHNRPYQISFSYGLVDVDENNIRSTDEIIEMADKKMYENKQKYKNSFIP
jgi:two-component system, cell cycle response regulator